MLNKINLKVQILLPLIVVIIVVLTTFYNLFNTHHNSDTRKTFKLETDRFTKRLNSRLGEDSRLMSGIIHQMQMNNDLQELWERKDRKELYAYTKDMYEEIRKKWRLTHFYFIGLDDKCFLRIHNPTRFGDTINRQTFNITKKTGEVGSGIELGIYGTFALRVVHPWKVKGKLVGYIELGEEIDIIPKQIYQNLGISSIFLINKKFVEKSNWKTGQKMLFHDHSHHWDIFKDFIISSETIHIDNLILSNDQDNLLYSTIYNNKVYEQRELKLRDVGDNIVGKIILLKNVSKEISKANQQSFLIVLFIVVVGGLLTLLFYFIVNRVEAKIKNVEEENNNIQKQLFQSSKLASIGELAAGVGHEINNPLAIVFGNLTRIKRELKKIGHFSGKLEQSINLQEDGIERITDIVDSLRTYARMDTSYYQAIDLNRLITKTQVLVGNQYEKEGIKIETNLNAGKSIIEGNIGKFQQIIMILLSNAKDAIEKRENPTITITTTSDDKEITISVSDNGSGIPETVKDKIFESFFTTKELGKGTGIGLALMHKIVDEMHGRITLESQEEVGTTFKVYFPLTDKDMTQEHSKKQIKKKLSGIALVIDDEEGIRDILVDHLNDLGLKVDAAESGAAALEKVKQKQYDYICTDMKMPKMTGDIFIEEAKKLPNGDSKYFIITGGVTTNFSSEKRKRLREIADGYIQKPFSEESIYEILIKFQDKDKTT